MNDIYNEKWQPVEKIDYMKRKPNEWANIYNLRLLPPYPTDELWSEYEWAFKIFNMKYYPLPDRNSKGKILDSYDKSCEMEMRAINLRKDLFMSADIGEKYVLETEKRFIETEWYRSQMML